MDTKELSIILGDVTYDLEIVLNNEIISKGTAICIDNNGTLVTAAHNVVRLNHIYEDMIDKKVKIYAKASKGENYKLYRIATCAPSWHMPEMTAPIIIDLAILFPIIHESDNKFISIRDTEPILGEPVMMAGFPDEVELPFSFDKILDTSRNDVQKQMAILPISRRILMIKSGIVGCNMGFTFTDLEKKNDWKGSLFYIDNVMHYGASGGPIIDYSGELLGVILKRAVTETGNDEILKMAIPSGSCMGISANSISILLNILPNPRLEPTWPSARGQGA
jgi:hypothetical protein